MLRLSDERVSRFAAKLADCKLLLKLQAIFGVSDKSLPDVELDRENLNSTMNTPAAEQGD